LPSASGAAGARAAVNENPCAGIPGCTAQVGPCVVVPAGQPGEPGTASGPQECDSGGPAASFAATNDRPQPLTFQPKLGCLETSGSAVAGSSAQNTPLRARSIEGKPHHRGRHRVTCRPGEPLIGRGAAVLFHTRQQPSRREFRQVHVRLLWLAKGIRVELRVGRHVGDDERVEPRVHVHCLAAGRDAS
jgi:hypothetical protein